MARIEVVLRRSHKGRVQIVYDDITIDMDRHLVTKAGEPVALTPKEFSLLAFFMENVDVAVTRRTASGLLFGGMNSREKAVRWTFMCSSCGKSWI